MNILATVLIRQRHAKTCLRAYADSEGPDQPAHPADQGFHCPLTKSLDTIECMNGEQRPGWYFGQCAGSESTHFAHVRRHFFAWRGPLFVRSTVLIFWVLLQRWPTKRSGKMDFQHFTLRTKLPGRQIFWRLVWSSPFVFSLSPSMLFCLVSEGRRSVFFLSFWS